MAIDLKSYAESPQRYITLCAATRLGPIQCAHVARHIHSSPLQLVQRSGFFLPLVKFLRSHCPKRARPRLVPQSAHGYSLGSLSSPRNDTVSIDRIINLLCGNK